MKVPFNDLSRIHNPIKKNVLSKLNKTIDKNEFILSDSVKKFENAFSRYTNSKYSISCSNGTDAIELVLRALGIGNQDEVIIPSNTFIATALAVTRAGATPILVDNNSFYLIDTDLIEKNITKKTKAIIGVHLYGQQADNKKISDLCKKYNLSYIEDSAQAHGSLYKHKPPGTYSIAATYSFYPGKNLGAWGDAGAVTTNNKIFAKKLESIRNWGSTKKYIHNEIGFNSRMNTLQAIVLTEKIKKIDDWNHQRLNIANYYIEELADIKNLTLPKVFEENLHVWHLFVIRTKKRSQLIRFMKEQNIELGIHYPKAIHHQRAYSSYKFNNSKFKNANKFSSQLVSLPIFPLMSLKEQEYVVKNIYEFFKK